MTVRIQQPADFPGGRALVRGGGETRFDPHGLEIAIRRQDGESERYLDPRQPAAPWSTQRFAFPPLATRRDETGLWFELEHAVTYHMTANMSFVLFLFDRASGLTAQERAVWTGVRRLRSEPPEGWTPPPPPAPEEPPAPPPAAEPAPPASDPAAALVADQRPVISGPEPRPRQQGGRKGLWLGLGALLAVLAAATGYGLWTRADRAPPVATPADAGPAITLEGARAFLGSHPTPEAAAALAGRFLAAGALDGAFLLYRHAAEGGDLAAQLAVGAMYDPERFSAATSPLPAANPEQAAGWYRRAAEAGDAEAQFRLGKVLLSGRTEAADGPEQGVVWLRRAAEHGHTGARAALAAQGKGDGQ